MVKKRKYLSEDECLRIKTDHEQGMKIAELMTKHERAYDTIKRALGQLPVHDTKIAVANKALGAANQVGELHTALKTMRTFVQQHFPKVRTINIDCWKGEAYYEEVTATTLRV